MRERIKKFIALVMAIVVINQLPGLDLLISKAASNYIYQNTSITADSEDTYVLYSGGCTLDVASGISLAEISVTGPNTYIVENGGTINSVTSNNGTLNLNGGSYGIITNSQVSEGSGVIANGITANTITANGPIQFNGNNTVASLTASEVITGTGTVAVSDNLALYETIATINVDRETLVTALGSDVTVYYDGTAYIIPAGSTETTILSEYGTRVSFGPVNSFVTWSSLDGKLDTPLLSGESIGTYQCIVSEGYYFPEGYTVTTTGNATPTVTRVDESEIQVSYTVANTDSDEVIITFPTPNELENGTGTLTVPDVEVGDIWEASVVSNTNSTIHDGVMYKVKGTNDSTYTTQAPTSVGDYVARVILPKTGIYKELILTDEFSINPTPQVDGVGTFTIADTYYGVAVKPQISSTTNQIAGAVVEYKVYGASDATYSKSVPTAVGKYVARVVLPESDEYNEMVLTDEFSISYLPLPQNAYTLEGNIGSNGYYVSNVTVVAREGYAVSDSLDGEYVEQFSIGTSLSSKTIYVMDVSTGAKTEGVALSAINIDMNTPSIDAENNKTYYADSLAVSITDTNLASVLVNGEYVELNGNSAVLELKSEGGVEEYEIVVTDRAGNVKTMKVTVAAEWTKTGKIPSGTPVKLQAGENYTLGDGSWTVSGDSTTYAGGSTFYVGSEGKFTFNKQ